jgi:hypothetical protein
MSKGGWLPVLAADVAVTVDLWAWTTAAAHVLALQPTFRHGKQFSGANCAPALAASLGAALGEAGRRSDPSLADDAVHC